MAVMYMAVSGHLFLKVYPLEDDPGFVVFVVPATRGVKRL